MVSITLLELKRQADRLIKEIGDLERVEPYSYQQIISAKNVAIYQFKTDEDWTVRVQISTLGQPEFDSLKLPGKRENAYNIAYSVEGEQSQYKKTTYSKLIKILKTITYIVLEFVKKYPDAEALIFLAANKDPQKLLSNTDSQKSAIYKTIVIKQMNSFGHNWKLRDINVGDDVNFTGFAIYKTT